MLIAQSSADALRKSGIACLSLFLALIAALTASPMQAQVDFAGTWGQKFQEDIAERGDAAIGDYVSLPINDATRMRADAIMLRAVPPR